MQRIQTLYLLAATALMTIFFFSTLATFAGSEGVYSMSVFGIRDVEGTLIYNMLYLLIIAILALPLPFANIFLYKNRMLQVRLCVVQIILTAGLLIVGGVYFYLMSRFFGSELEVGATVSLSLRIVCLLPAVAIFFDYLALKAIFKDELLIRSLDRIR